LHLKPTHAGPNFLMPEDHIHHTDPASHTFKVIPLLTIQPT